MQLKHAFTAFQQMNVGDFEKTHTPKFVKTRPLRKIAINNAIFIGRPSQEPACQPELHKLFAQSKIHHQFV